MEITWHVVDPNPYLQWHEYDDQQCLQYSKLRRPWEFGPEIANNAANRQRQGEDGNTWWKENWSENAVKIKTTYQNMSPEDMLHPILRNSCLRRYSWYPPSHRESEFINVIECNLSQQLIKLTVPVPLALFPDVLRMRSWLPASCMSL